MEMLLMLTPGSRGENVLDASVIIFTHVISTVVSVRFNTNEKCE